MLKKLLSSESGKIMISCILGLGLASLFKKVCVDDNCLIIKTDPNWKSESKIFQQNSKCFKFKRQDYQCKN